MAHDVFISYSSKDQAAAQAICGALERSDISCWIAPRNIESASGWGGSIIKAIEASKAVLVVFSEHSNASPQVVREMEAAVGKRLPLIPIRIADAMPTQDMQYFLGVSHWFDAYPRPLDEYLSRIVDTTRRVLDGESAAWNRARRLLPQQRRGQLALLGGALAVAVVTAWLMRPTPIDPMDALRSPMFGRWQTTFADAGGREVQCLFDVQDLGAAIFSDDCPLPMKGASVNLTAMRDGTYAPQLFNQSKDTGTYIFMGDALHGVTGAFQLDGRNGLITRDPQRGEIVWKRVKAEGKLPNAADGVLPLHVEWPVKDVPALAQRALTYARDRWQPDALLMRLALKISTAPNQSVAQAQTPSGGIEVQFAFYSPTTQHGLMFEPNRVGNLLRDTGAQDMDESRALPPRFLDLPDVVAYLRQRRMRAKEITLAELEWSTGPLCGSFRETNAVVPPCGNAPRYKGVQWRIVSALSEQFYVAATTR
jgi:hypothetical protein